MSDKKKQREIQLAAALQYEGTGTPTVVAKGQGEVAARIEAIARRHDVPLVKDAVLTGLLANVPLGEEIPESLFVAVAEVLVHIYRVGDSLDSYQ